jgi:hypothetical protein
MKKRRALIALFTTALIITIILISMKAYYVTIALLCGTVIIGYREIWSLLRRRKPPPFDERVRENTSKAVRNGFIFFVLATAFLMLPFTIRLAEGPDTVIVLAGLFLGGGTVYLLSYLYYDRVESGLGERGLRILRIFLLVAGISVAAAIISIFLHNAIYGLFIYFFGENFWDKTGLGDEPVFFFITLLSVAALAVGIIGSLVMYIKGLFSRSP